MHADLPSQVRYLARRQEREVRRHIEEYRSPYQRSFKAKLQEACDEVEDTCRVDVESVIRDDAPLDASLDSLTGAAREALFNAAKHSGAKVVHLYSEVSGGWARADIRDRGNGLVGDQRALSDSLSERVAAARGSAVVRSTPDEGTDVMITVPWP
jgi:signal transduction histidine kinase